MNESILLKARFVALAATLAALPFSIAICHLCLGLFLIITLLEGKSSERIRIVLRNPLVWLPIAWFMLHLAGVFISSNTDGAWSQVEKKATFLLAPLVLGSATAFSKSEIDRLAMVFVAACVVGTFVCFGHAILTADATTPFWNFGPSKPFQDLHPDASNLWPYFTYIGFASGIGIHPTYFAFYLLVCLLILIERQWLNQTWTLVLMLYLVGVIFLLSSRIVVLLTFATCLFFAIKSKHQVVHRWILAGCVALVAAGLLLLNPVANYRNTQEYTRTNLQWPPAPMSDNPINIRVSLWWLSTQAISTVNPLIGTGPGDVKDRIHQLADELNVHNKLDTYDPHNQFIYTYLGLGAIGLAILFAMLVVALRSLWKAGCWTGVAALLAWICVCLTESALESQKGIVLFTLFVSLAANQLRTVPQSMSNKLATRVAIPTGSR